MKLTDFLAPVVSAPVPFDVEGIDEKLYCRILTCEEAASIAITPEEATTPGNGFRFAARLLALSIVDAAGVPCTTEASWKSVSVLHQKGVSRICDKVREINGLQTPAEVKELGNASTAIPESGSSSSSASDSEKPAESSAA